MFYWGNPTLVEKAVLFGETLEDGKAKYYHCAIAINQSEVFQTDGAPVVRAPIDLSRGFDVYRPPITDANIKVGLDAVAALLGEGYDWWLIEDHVLRDLSGGHVHLPESFIATKEEYLKVCSTLMQYYLKKCHFYTCNKWDTPEGLAVELHEYKTNLLLGP